MATTYEFPDDRVDFTWDDGNEPVLTIETGDTVVYETRDVSDNQITPDSTAEAIAALDWDRVYPLAGPVLVEGAEPGDTLAIEILNVETRGWGYTLIIPGFGLLPDDFPDPYIASSTSRTASSRICATTSRSRSSPSSERWACVPRARRSRRSCRPAGSGGTWTRGSSCRARRSTCRWRSGARSSAAATRTRPRATARRARPASRRRCTASSASRSRRAGKSRRRST